MTLKSWKFWLGICISVVFLYLFLKDIDWAGLWETLKAVHVVFLVFIAAINLFSFVLRAIRWRYFFHEERIIPFISLFSATAIGFMANTVLPLRVGEIIRGVFLGQKEHLSKSMCLGTLVLERLFDMIAILFYFALFIVVYSLPTGEDAIQQEYVRSITIAGYTSGLLCVVVIVFLIALRFQTSAMLSLVGWFSQLLPEKFRDTLLQMVRAFISGLDILRDLPSFLMSVFLSLLIWLIIIFQTYLLFVAFDIPLGFPQAIFLLVIMAFSVMVPAAPGYVGTYHYGTSVALALMGVGGTVAKGVAIVSHLLSMFPITIVGFFFLWYENLSLLDLQRQQLGNDVSEETGPAGP